jgi:hypothetical protein
MKVNQAIIMKLANERNTRSFLTHLPSALTTGGSEAYRAIMYRTAQLGHSVTATAAAAASSVSASAASAASSLSAGGLSMEDIMRGERSNQRTPNDSADRTTSRDSTEDFLTLITATRDDDEKENGRLKQGDIDLTHSSDKAVSSDKASTADETRFVGAHKVVPSLDGYFDCSSAMPFDPHQHGDDDQQVPFMGGVMPGHHHLVPQQVEHAVNHNQHHHHAAGGAAPFNQFADDEDDREYLEHFGQPRVFFDPLTQDWTAWWTCCGKGEVLVEAAPSAASIAASQAAARTAVIAKQKEEEKRRNDPPITIATTKSTSSLLNSSYFQKVAKKIGAQQEPIFLSLKNMYRSVKKISLDDEDA